MENTPMAEHIHMAAHMPMAAHMSMASNIPKNSLQSGLRCSVPNCNRSRRKNPEIKLFKFPPPNSALGKIWLKKCKISYLKNLRICDIHFPKKFIGIKKLKAGAVPSLKLRISDNENASLCNQSQDKSVLTSFCSSTGEINEDSSPVVNEDTIGDNKPLLTRTSQLVIQSPPTQITPAVKLVPLSTLTSSPAPPSVSTVTVPELKVMESSNTSTSIDTVLPKKLKISSSKQELIKIAREYLCKPESMSEIIAKGWALKLRKMKPEQQLYAEKAINHILIGGQLGLLHYNN